MTSAMSASGELGIGLLGMGVVGGQVARLLLEQDPRRARLAGRPLRLRRALVRDPSRPRPLPLPLPEGLLTTDPDAILSDPAIDVVIEVMGGVEPARTLIERALRARKHVVTANKEVIAHHGPALSEIARRSGVHLRFEAAVGGGIPIISPLSRDLLANDIGAIRAIINGTTNYILTKMAREGLDFQVALAQAQHLGYAEPDPANDIQGADAACKIAILATLAFHSHVPPDQVYREGIARLHPKDFRYAHELGYEIKLLAIARKHQGAIQARVHPALVHLDTPLAKVEGPGNAIEVQGDLTGPVVFYGQGAGAGPTASAILGDLLAIATSTPRATADGASPSAPPMPWPILPVEPLASLTTRYYLRLTAADRSGVLAQIGATFGRHDISLASVIQKDADPTLATAELVITTHPASEAAMQRALEELRALQVVRALENLIRIEPA